MNKKLNPVIQAVQKLRKLVIEITNYNHEINDHDLKIKKQLETAGIIIGSLKNNNINEIWLTSKESFIKNSDYKLNNLKKIENILNIKKIDGIDVILEEQKNYDNIVSNDLKEMDEFGKVIFTGKELLEWDDIWSKIKNELNSINSITEIYCLKINMIKELEPSEIDDLTKDILKHIPWNYTDEEAYQYEQEYIQAYNELKIEAKNKNLWDKILDILAGGIQENPAHRVQMRRWMEGDL